MDWGRREGEFAVQMQIENGMSNNGIIFRFFLLIYLLAISFLLGHIVEALCLQFLISFLCALLYRQ